jgi:DNA repair exonuclease SbcCD ATPase subunit
MSEALIRAQQQLRDLEQRQQKMAATTAKLAEARKQIGFAVFADGDAKARKKLDALNVEGGQLAGELEAIEAAIVEAQRRVQLAKQAGDRAADHAKAQELLLLAASFDDQVTKLGEAADALVLACSTLAMLHAKAYSLGAGRPTEQQLKIMLGRIVTTTVMRAGLQQQIGTEFLAPADRKTADALRQYADVIRAAASARLGDENREAA